jgi:hypothetical protein
MGPDMSTDRKHIQFDEFLQEAPTIFDEVETSGEEVVIGWHGKLFRIRPKRAPKPHGRKHFGPNDSLFGFIGVGSSGRQDLSAGKYKYLADAIADAHDGSENGCYVGSKIKMLRWPLRS